MKPAARLSDIHICPQILPAVPPIPHIGGPILMASANVIIGGQPAARVSDQCICMAVGIPDPISTGSATVHINELMAARMGDMTGHGGMVASGCFTVLIGDSTTSGSGGAGQGTSAAGAAEPPSPLASGAALTAPLLQAAALIAAALSGAPFCEPCMRAAVARVFA